MAFPNFSLLPTELRLLVWKHTLPARPEKFHLKLIRLTEDDLLVRMTTDQLPSTFHICRESRQEAFFHARRRGLIHWSVEGRTPRPVMFFFDPRQTIITLEHIWRNGRALDYSKAPLNLRSFLDVFRPETLEVTQHVIFIDHCVLIDPYFLTRVFLGQLCRLRNLQTFIPVLDEWAPPQGDIRALQAGRETSTSICWENRARFELALEFMIEDCKSHKRFDWAYIWMSATLERLGPVDLQKKLVRILFGSREGMDT